MVSPNQRFGAVRFHGLNRTIKYFNGMQFKIGTVPKEGMNEFGKYLRGQLRRELMIGGDDPKRGPIKRSGNLWNQIKWVQRKDRGHMSVPAYGIMLDRMKAHHIKLIGSRTRILTWIARKPVPKLFGAKYIFVKPRQWIDKPTLRAIKRLPHITKKMAERIVEK